MNLPPRQIAIEYIKYTRQSIFLTGKAGTGKTTLLKEIIQTTDKKHIICAPTGVAAINAGGVTIHSLFQLPTSSFLPGSDTSNYGSFTNHYTLSRTQKIRKDRIKLLAELELLIIDEISMVRADILDAVDFILRRFRKSDAPFGGVQMLVIGDLYQLSPVVNDIEWRTLGTYYKSPFFFDAMSWQRASAITVQLEKVYRQEDPTFVNILNRIRTGKALQEDIDVINDRWEVDHVAEAVTLTTHNAKASKINHSKLESLATERIEMEASVRGKFNESAYPVKEKLELKEQAQVMFVRNHPEGLYYNGMLGTVTGKTNELLKVRSIERDQTILVDQVEWKNVKYSVDAETKEIKQVEIGSFKQYPLKLAWAITVHKSQGLTFDHLIVDLEDTFAAGQLYVALSRGRSLEGLFLKSKVSLHNVIADQRILDFFEKVGEELFDPEHLKRAKARYENDLLVQRWKLQPLKIFVEIAQEEALDLQLQDELKANQVIQSVHEEVEKLEGVAAKFQKQLLHLIAQYESDDSVLDQIIDRCQKGINYFLGEVEKNILPKLEKHQKDFAKKKSIRSYQNSLKELIDELWYFVDGLYNMSYRGITIFKGDRTLKRTKFFDPKPAKRKKGETYKVTLDLLNENHSIEQIAQLRNLAISTIEGHLGKLLTEGQVDIQQLMNHKRIDKIKPYILAGEYDSFGELMTRMPFKVSFSELRWVKAYLDKEGIVD